MRLIDADRLLNPGYTDMFDEPMQFAWYSREAIETQPTVEAIPVEWLEMFMRRYKIEGGNEYKLLHFMITEWKKWEKENETTHENASDK